MYTEVKKKLQQRVATQEGKKPRNPSILFDPLVASTAYKTLGHDHKVVNKKAQSTSIVARLGYVIGSTKSCS